MIIARIAARIEKGKTEILKPIIHDLEPHCKHHNQNAVTFSSIQMHKLLGICKISVKKTKEEQSKNKVKKGAKTKLPTIVSKENGNPHAIRTGSEIRDKKNCT